MLLTTDDTKVSELEREMGSASSNVGGPPPYDSSFWVPSPRTPFRPRPLFPASNFVKIKRSNTSVKGTFVIDPGLSMPEDSDSAGGDFGAGGVDCRKNLDIASANGCVSADVWLVDDEVMGGGGNDMPRKRAELELKSNNGSVNVKLDTTTTRPYSLVVNSLNGSISVAIPSDFVGPVTLTARHWCVSLPGSMETRLTTFSEDKMVRNCFIGDYRRVGYTSRQTWNGPIIDVGTHNGRVTLSFVDEERKNVGFWCRMFGG